LLTIAVKETHQEAALKRHWLLMACIRSKAKPAL
jgi:hypothetical protein